MADAKPVFIPDGKVRCTWCGSDPLYVAYHDQEWGRPVRDDRVLFEMLNLEGAQAGLSWITVLRKRDCYRELFADFDPDLVSAFSDARLEEILLNPGIIRNRLKVYGVRENARAYLKLVEQEGSFAAYLWSFVGGETKRNSIRDMKGIQSKTLESDAMSKALKKRGFKFVGSTICYAFMQAVGMVDDHLDSCFCKGNS